VLFFVFNSIIIPFLGRIDKAVGLWYCFRPGTSGALKLSVL